MADSGAAPATIPTMFQDLAKRPAAIASAGAVLTCLWLLVTNWGPIRYGHPTYLVFYLGLSAVGMAVIVRWWRDPERTGRLWLSIIGAIAMVAFSLLAIWLRPFGATEVALDAMEGSDSVTVTQDGSRIVMDPVGVDPTAGLIFYPGARVDSRAYANVLAPVVEAGYQVVIVKAPVGIAFFSTSFAQGWIADHPDIDTWVVGGHSLGGVVGSTSVDGDRPVAGLVFYASYPLSDLSDRAQLAVSSIYGLNDGIAEPSRIEQSATDLPESAVLVPIEGAVHSDFGDYGLQPGDGRPGITRPEAQAIIAEATLALMARVSP